MTLWKGLVYMFDIKYIPLDDEYGNLHIIVDKKDLTEYEYNSNIFYGICRGKTLCEWFKNNIKHILVDEPFPVKTCGITGASMWLNSNKYVKNNIKELHVFHELRQDWLWRHSLETCKEEFCLPFIVFRKVESGIEISWNNKSHHYEGVEFKCLEGFEVVNEETFKNKVLSFICNFDS